MVDRQTTFDTIKHAAAVSDRACPETVASGLQLRTVICQQRACVAPSNSYAGCPSLACRLYVSGSGAVFIGRSRRCVGLYCIYGAVFGPTRRDAADCTHSEPSGRELRILSICAGWVFSLAGPMAFYAWRLAVCVYWRWHSTARCVLQDNCRHRVDPVGRQDVMGDAYLRKA